MPDERDWVDAVASINQWRRGGERAPHKPLLLLFALARLQRRQESAMRYRDVEQELDALLKEFGPPRTTSPSYPFHHLATDGVWTVSSDDGDRSPGAARGVLRSTNAVGQLEPAFEASLRRDPTLLARVSHLLLDANFEPSVQEDLVERLGLDLAAADLGGVSPTQRSAPRRDPTFRDRVLVAYEYRCAMCGIDPQVDNLPVGIDAAHVQWWASGGPDDLSNGVCLCSLHHKLFDRGVLGLDEDRQILVSDRFRAAGALAQQVVLDLCGQALAEPQAGKDPVGRDHIAWHRREVFRGDPRQCVA